MHPISILAFGTLLVVLAYAAWNLTSVRRHRAGGRPAAGIGGAKDPLSGEGADIRHPEAMRSDMDRASDNPETASASPRAKARTPV